MVLGYKIVQSKSVMDTVAGMTVVVEFAE